MFLWKNKENYPIKIPVTLSYLQLCYHAFGVTFQHNTSRENSDQNAQLYSLIRVVTYHKNNLKILFVHISIVNP